MIVAVEAAHTPGQNTWHCRGARPQSGRDLQGLWIVAPPSDRDRKRCEWTVSRSANSKVIWRTSGIECLTC
jgi:hypothetical protein